LSSLILARGGGGHQRLLCLHLGDVLLLGEADHGHDLLQPRVDGSQLGLHTQLEALVIKAMNREQEAVQLGDNVT